MLQNREWFFLISFGLWGACQNDESRQGLVELSSEKKGLEALSDINNLSQVMQTATSGDTIQLPQTMPDHVVYGTVLSVFFSSEKCAPNQIESNLRICEERLALIIEQFQIFAKGYQKGMSDFKIGQGGERITCANLKKPLKPAEFFQNLQACGKFVLTEYINFINFNQSVLETYPSAAFSPPPSSNEPTRGLFFMFPLFPGLNSAARGGGSSTQENQDIRQLRLTDRQINQMSIGQRLHHLKQHPYYQEEWESYKRIRQNGFNTVVLIRGIGTPFLRVPLIMLKEAGFKVIIWFQNVFKRDPQSSFPAPPSSLFQESDFLSCVVDGKRHLDITKPDVREKIYQFHIELFNRGEGLLSGYMLDDHLSYNYYQSNAQKMEPCLPYQTAQNQLNQFVREFTQRMKQAFPNSKSILAHHPLNHARQHFAADWSQWRSYFDELYIQGYVESHWNDYLGDLQRGQFDGILLPLGSHFQQFSTCGAIQKALEMKRIGKNFFLYRDYNREETSFVNLYLKGERCP
jgi:hypothetical protein